MQITALLPKSWFVGLMADSTIPPLEPLCRFMVSAAQNLNTLAMNKEVEKREARYGKRPLSNYDHFGLHLGVLNSGVLYFDVSSFQ